MKSAYFKDWTLRFVVAVLCCIACLVLPLDLTLLFSGSSTFAQGPTPTDGTIIEQSQCAPNTVTYEQYLESSKRSFADEIDVAKREGFQREMPATLPLMDRAEF